MSRSLSKADDILCRGRNRLAEIEQCCWPGCDANRYAASDAPPLCGNHLVKCATYITDSMTALLGESRRPGDPVPAELVADPASADSVVYYVRIGQHIKIGTTTNLPARLRSLSIDHDSGLLLATEPGGRKLEAHRHAEFVEDRLLMDRELFRPSQRLRNHIAALTSGTT